MNPIVKAQQAAIAHIDRLLGTANIAAERERLSKLGKKELIEIILSSNKVKKPSIEEISYAIQEDPDCAWLTYESIATLINKKVPGANTNAGCQSWYFSQQRNKGRDCVTRKSLKEITKAALG